MYRALVVDDEPMIWKGMKNLIDWAGFGFSSVETAEDGEAALESIGQKIPDILVTDIMMPKMNGIDLLKNIRNQELDIRVIVLSGYDDFEYVRSMAALGIENYLLKPVNENEFYQTILNVVKKLEKRTEQQAASQLNANLIRENIINRWIYGSIGENELIDRAEFLGLDLHTGYYRPCILKTFSGDVKKNALLRSDIHKACIKILSAPNRCYCSQNYDGDTIVIFWGNQAKEAPSGILELLNRCMDEIHQCFHVQQYVLLGDAVQNFWEVADSFRTALKGTAYLTAKVETPHVTTSGVQDTGSSPFSLRLAQYVHDNYYKDLSLKLLAAHFKGNAAYIGQVFKRDIGESFSDYLKMVQIEKAKELFQKTNLSAKQISVKVGFRNETYFFSVFKKVTGMSPMEYKKILTEQDN